MHEKREKYSLGLTTVLYMAAVSDSTVLCVEEIAHAPKIIPIEKKTPEC